MQFSNRIGDNAILFNNSSSGTEYCDYHPAQGKWDWGY